MQGKQGLISEFWAKFEAPESWHPAFAHCADVAACGEALLQKTRVQQRLARAGGHAGLSDQKIQRLCVLIALHDLGKWNEGFQGKICLSPLFGKFPKSGHEGEALYLLACPGKHKKALEEAILADSLREWVEDGAWKQILAASINHHGVPRSPTAVPSHYDPCIWSPRSFEGLSLLLRKLKDWFPLAFESGGDLLPGCAAFQHALSGLVVAADWIGSSTEWFPYLEDPEDDRMTFARKRAALALEQIGISTSSHRANVPEEAGILFSRLSGYSTPRGVQEAISKITSDWHSGSLVLIEAETGAGKTEAALLHFFRLFREGHVDGMFFALPTRTAATQLYRRVLTATQNVLGENAPPVVLAVPGYLEVDGVRGIRVQQDGLPFPRVLWPDEQPSQRGWSSEAPVRFLAGAIAVGTIDQVLLSSLRTKHSHFRASMLSRQLLVVDEVHASDVYMGRLLEEVLRFQGAMGGHSLLMSATLGSAQSSKLFGIPLPPFEDSLKIPYPALSWKDGGLSHRGHFESHKSKKVFVDLMDLAGDHESVADLAKGAASQGARVLIIRNTVGDCIKTQEALEAHEPLLFKVDGMPAPHHSRFAKADREILDERVETYFGKSAQGNKGIILCATQTIQQSLDLDADLLITDLCPMDILLQRIGRLFRHERPRTKSFTSPRVIVLCPQGAELGEYIRKDFSAQGPHGIGRVYPDLLVMEATMRACRSGVFDIPEDNRRLVEETTHPSALGSLARSLGPRWIEHARRVRSSHAVDKMLAGGVLVDREAEFLSDEVAFSKENLEVRTRLGMEDIHVRLDPPPQSPFGKVIYSLVFPFFLAGGKDMGEIPDTVHVESLPEGFRFKIGSVIFTYNNYGLQTRHDNE